jgi:predicted TIM-barrel fold metal-dependent hydrolase
MQPDDLILVSVDDHVVEPAHLFEGRLPAKYVDVAPKFVHQDDGTDVWIYDGNILPNIGLNAVAGRPPEEYGMEPTSFDELRSGCYDIGDRLRDMDANGVIGSMCFPSFPNLCGQLFSRSSDLEAGLAVLQAYNDWHIDDWCGAAPDRFIPLMIPPIWDAELMAAEVRRCAAKGCHAVSFSENPSKLKLPSFHDPYWDPFWQACVDEGTIVCLHIGSSSRLVITAPDAPVDVLITLQPINIVQAAADLLWSPVLRKFPDLRVSLSEGGIGWVPYFCDRVDWIYTRHHRWTGQDFGGRLPSEVFLERVVLCFIDDPAGVANLDRLRVDGVCWEADYPHSDSTWPISPETLWPSIEGLTDSVIDQITHTNAMRHFRLDPFRHRPREACTVGALRATATDVDVTPRPGGRRTDHKTGAAELIHIGESGRR